MGGGTDREKREGGKDRGMGREANWEEWCTLALWVILFTYMNYLTKKGTLELLYIHVYIIYMRR